MNAFAVVILVALIGEYVLSMLSSALNLSALSPAVPGEFSGVFDEPRYARSQDYTRTRTQLGFVQSTVNLVIILGWWRVGGFEWLDQLLRAIERARTIYQDWDISARRP